MRKFQATVRVNLDGRDAVTVRQLLEEELRKTQLTRWRLVSIDGEDAKPRPLGGMRRPAIRRREINTGALLLVGAVTWAVWFFWLLVG